MCGLVRFYTQMAETIDQAHECLCAMKGKDGRHPLAYQQATTQHAVIAAVYVLMGRDQAELVRQVMELLQKSLEDFIPTFAH